MAQLVQELAWQFLKYLNSYSLYGTLILLKAICSSGLSMHGHSRLGHKSWTSMLSVRAKLERAQICPPMGVQKSKVCCSHLMKDHQE